MRAKYAMAISAAALLAVISGPSLAGVTTGTCKSPTTYFAASEDPGSTSSTTWGAVPDGILGIRTAKVGCLEVDFVADVFINPNDYINVEAVLDGTAMNPGSFIVDDGDWEYGRTVSIKWVVSNVPIGFHQININWETGFGSEAFIGAHTATLVY